MHWFFIAIWAPFLWGIVNHIDKYLLDKYFHARGIGALLIYSSLISVLVLPVVFIIDPSVLEVPLDSIMLLLLVGLISACAILFYLFAMNEDEASVVMPFFQTIPIFGILLSYLILGEKLTSLQLIPSLIIICGAAILSLDIRRGKTYQVKFKLIFYTLLSSFLYALYPIIFKYTTVLDNFWTNIFWQHVGLLLVGLSLLIFNSKYRKSFLTSFKSKSVKIVSINVGSEIITTIGNLLLAFATLLAPVALVLTVELYQPAFVFLLGIIFTLFYPSFAKEKMTRSLLIQKTAGIIIVIVGSILLYYAV